MANIDFSKFEIVYKDRISKSELLTSLNFLKSIEIELKDITDENQKANYQKVVIATYKFQGKSFSSKPLFYKNILHTHSVKNADSIIKYFEDDVFWLDIDEHDWPKPKGETEIESLIIDDITDDPEFKLLLKRLANNQNRGVLQRITLEGKTNQYYRNFENNNHWHDIIILIKEVIRNKPIDKKFFSPLIFRWDGNKNTNRERVSLSSRFGSRKFIDCLIENVKELLITNPLDMNTSYIDLLNYKKQIILQGPPGTGKTKLAKEIAGKLIGLEETQSSKPMATITIDDIKRFISLGQKIKSATDYTEYTIQEVGNSNISVKLKDSDSIYKPSYKEIIYAYNIKMWDGKQSQGNDPYASAIAKYIFSQDIVETTKIEDSEQFKLIQFHPSYTYEDFVRGIVANSKGEKIEYKNVNKLLGKLAIEASKKPNSKYVLIIDEINRANLSSVLGELIYALEYRGKKVDSMYEVEGSNQIILPPNLYIIGTMNTADRSVGHIDYAMRRRFAFVDVLPKDLTKENEIVFKIDTFKQVTSLFVNNYDPDIDYNTDDIIIEKSSYLTADFEPKDVWLGHSYFIQQYEKDQKGNDDLSKPIAFSLRIKYEIKPILEEYIKDGILKETAREVIKNLA